MVEMGKSVTQVKTCFILTVMTPTHQTQKLDKKLYTASYFFCNDCLNNWEKVVFMHRQNVINNLWSILKGSIKFFAKVPIQHFKNRV